MVLLSGVFGWLGVAVEDPRPIGAAGRVDNGMIEAVSLMSADGLRRILMLPYSIFFTLSPAAQFFVRVFSLGLPVGPGSPTFYTPGG